MDASSETVNSSGQVTAWIFSHPIWFIVIILAVLLCLLLLYKFIVHLNNVRKNRNEVASLKKDLMIWSVLSNLVRGGRKTDQAKLELNNKLRHIEEIFEHAQDQYKAQTYLSSQRPWYVVLGEPSCGKTSLIIHSELDFKSTEYGKVEGLPVNFYLNRDAVMVDVSGHVFFDNWLGGSSAEWSHICKLLHKHRAKRPVNGVILTVSAEALLADDRKLTQKKASLMVSELLRLTGTLGMYLPCYLVVTKLDTILGFREFFSNLDEVNKNQPVGFQPLNLKPSYNEDDFARFFDDLLERFTQGLYGLFQSKSVIDLTYNNLSRLNLTGDMYLFKGNFEKIRTNLTVYLDTLFGDRFIAGENYFRFKGVFFTSAEDKGFCLNRRFASLQKKDIDDAPLYDNGVKNSRPYFISSLFTKVIFPSADDGAFTRHEQIRRHMPLYLCCGALSLLSLFYWYGILFDAKEVKRSLYAEEVYYSQLQRSFEDGAIDGARLFGVEESGAGEVLFNTSMPNDPRVTRMNYFFEAQRRINGKVTLPWTFFPMTLLRFGWSRETDIENRYYVYNRIQTKMAYHPLVQSVEYNLLKTGADPYTELKRNALFELASISLFNVLNDGNVSNLAYTPSNMKSLMEYMFPEIGDSSKQHLEYFLPEYDYNAYIFNSRLVLDQNYVDSCNYGIQNFINNWRSLANYPEFAYPKLRTDIRAATNLIEVYQDILDKQKFDFKSASYEQLQNLFRDLRGSILLYFSSVNRADDMVNLVQKDKTQGVLSAFVANADKNLKSKVGAGIGKDGQSEAENAYVYVFEQALDAYTKQLYKDFAFFRDFDRLRDNSEFASNGIYFGGLNFREFQGIRDKVANSLKQEADGIRDDLTTIQQSELFKPSVPQNRDSQLNYRIVYEVLKLAILEVYKEKIWDPDQIEHKSELIDNAYRHQLEMLDTAEKADHAAISRPLYPLVRKLLNVQYAMAQYELAQEVLAFYPNEASDLNMLSDLTMMVADKATSDRQLEKSFSVELAQSVLGPFELRSEYDPPAFLTYLKPIANFIRLMRSKTEELSFLREHLKQSSKLMKLIKIFGKYTGSYLNYWAHVTDGVHLHADSYADFYYLATETKAYQVNAQLQEMYNLSRDAIDHVDKEILDENAKKLRESALKQLDNRSNALDMEFTDTCNDVLTAWSLLTEDATYANRLVMHMSDKELKSSLLKLGKPDKGKSASEIPWWSQFTDLGVKLLKRDASSEAAMSLAMFQNRLKFFPLVSDGDVHARLLEKDDIKSLMLLFKSYGLTDQNADQQKDPLAGFALGNEGYPDGLKDLSMANNLKSPLVFSVDSGRQSSFKVWSNQMEAVLTFLSGSEKTNAYKLSVVNAADHEKLRTLHGFTGYEMAIGRYRYFDITIGKSSTTERMQSFTNHGKNRVITGGPLGNDEITFNFYHYSDDKEPACTYVYTGSYPSLQMYLDPESEYDDATKISYVPLLLKSEQGVESIFFVGIQFTSKMPSKASWPSLAQWPDMSMFKQ